MRTPYLPALTVCLLSSLVPSTAAHAAFLPTPTGEVARYRLTYHGDGTMNLRALMSQQAGGTPDKMASDLEAQMEVVQVAPGTMAVRLLTPTYRLNVNGQSPDLSSQIATLESPCYLTVNAAGRVHSLSFAPQTPAAARTLLRSVVSGLQFTRPNANARAWRTRQDTANGEAVVDYRTVDGGTLEKRIVDYPVTRQIGPKGDPVLHHVTQGALRFTFSEGHLVSAGGTLTTRSTVTGRFLSEARERFTLNRIGGGSEPAATLRDWDADRRARVLVETPAPLTAPDRDAATQRASWRQLLGDATQESLLKDLRALDAAGARNDTSLYSRLCALLSLQPEAARGMADGVSGFGPAPMSVRLVGAALGSVASEPECVPNAAAAAEGALREMLSARQDSPDAVLILAPALASTRSPQPETLRLLQTLSRNPNTDTAISCTLALGRLARICPPETARAIVRSLTERLTAAAGSALEQPLLAALGNAGSADGLAAVTAYTHHRSAILRGIAYMSLRFIPGARPMALLEQRGLSDPDAGVRLNAARALQFRPFSTADLSVVARAIGAEREASVRLSLLENVRLEAPYYPQAARPILERARTQDASADNRRTVAGWLGS